MRREDMRVFRCDAYDEFTDYSLPYVLAAASRLHLHENTSHLQIHAYNTQQSSLRSISCCALVNPQGVATETTTVWPRRGAAPSDARACAQ